MKDIGALARQKVKVLFGMLKAMYTEVNLNMTWQMAMVNTLTSMAPGTRESLSTMFKKATEKKSGLMAPNMWAIITTE